MNKQLLTKLFDPKNIAAVEFLAGEDADAVLATWYRMLSLAVHDPEGCVRLTPGLHMEAEELATYFNCPADVLEATIQILEQLQQLTREADGTLKLNACAGLCRRRKTKKSVDATVGATEKETEKEKRKEPKEKNKENNKKTDIAAAISAAHAREAAAADQNHANANATAAANNQNNAVAAATEKHNTATATQNLFKEAQNNDLPAQPCRKNSQQIPLNQLSETEQKILNAWNALPLYNNFDGLFPAMRRQLQALVERYGEEALLKAIGNVANSPFLLGCSRNSRGWVISFDWFLVPEHLENILQGKYQNKKPKNGSLLFQPGDEDTPYGNGFYGVVVD